MPSCREWGVKQNLRHKVLKSKIRKQLFWSLISLTSIGKSLVWCIIDTYQVFRCFLDNMIPYEIGKKRYSLKRYPLDQTGIYLCANNIDIFKSFSQCSSQIPFNEYRTSIWQVLYQNWWFYELRSLYAIVATNCLCENIHLKYPEK